MFMFLRNKLLFYYFNNQSFEELVSKYNEVRDDATALLLHLYCVCEGPSEVNNLAITR